MMAALIGIATYLPPAVGYGVLSVVWRPTCSLDLDARWAVWTSRLGWCEDSAGCIRVVSAAFLLAPLRFFLAYVR